MGQLVEPKVFLVGEQAIVREGMEAYLRHTKQEAFLVDMAEAYAAGLTDIEVLSSFFAKLCYKSLVAGKNANITRTRSIEDNIKGTMDHKHGSVLEHGQWNFTVTDCSRVFTHELVRHRVGTAFCLAGDTLVYSGSKVNGRWDGVRKSWTLEQLHGWAQDPQRKGRLKLLTVRCFDGEQFVPAKIKGVTQSGIKNVFRVTLADDTVIRCSEDHRFLATQAGRKDWHPLRNLVAGDFMATNGVAVYKSPDWLRTKYLDESLTQAEMAKLAGVSEATIKKWLANHEIKKPGSGHFAEGQEPWNAGKSGYKLRSFTAEERAVISERMTGDGNHRWKGADATQQVGRQRAWKMFEAEPCKECNNPDGHRHHVDRNPLNNLRENIEFLCNKCHAIRHYAEDGPTKALTARYVEIVSIVEEGPAMTYDLEVDHPAHNFVANGIVTHNSQTSGRYVRPLDDDGNGVLDIAFDPILEPIKSHVQEAIAYLEQWYATAVNKMGLDDAKKSFDWKKKATSALRRLMPNGQSNEIGFSVNWRAVRALVMLRTARLAEWEIRQVFYQIYSILKARHPLVFHGAKEEMVDGCIEVSGMQLNPWELSPEEILSGCSDADVENEALARRTKR